MTYPSRLLALALTLATALGAQPQPGSTPVVTAAAVNRLGAYEVTGSRIKRLDAETVSPVVSLTGEDIALSGFQTVGDVVRNLPYSNSTSVDPQFGTGFASGATSLNLRGLGVNNTLVLVNGRRAAPYGLPGGTGFTTLFDFNSLPLAAIESIEILKDGASAIYGSDAAAGVVNIKLRTTYSGLSTSALYGNTTDTDSSLRRASVTWGATRGKTSVLLAADWQKRNELSLRDRDFSKTADGRAFGGQDARSTTGFPGYVVVPVRDAAGRTPPAGTITAAIISPQGVLLANPTVADFARGASLYNFNPDTSMLPAHVYKGLYLRAKHELNEQLYVFGEFALRKNRSQFVQAATPVVSTIEAGTGANGVMRLPFNNPYNPFGVDIDNFRLRLVGIGPRVRDTESFTSRYLAGLGGRLGWGDWTWEAAALYSKNKVNQHDKNSAADAAVQAALNQTSRATALNPFGPSAAGVVEALATTTNRRSIVDIRQGDVQATGHLWRLPAGEIGVAVGAEHRRESIRDRPDPVAASGGILGSGGNAGLSGTRRVAAAYVEISLPILRQLEVQLAGRHEEYSDFGQADKPKVGAKYRATKWLLLRGAYSRSFRAPDLTQLYTAQNISFSTAVVLDPLRPNDPPQSVRQIGGGNPTLQPELTDSYYAGAIVEVPGVKGLEASVDFWRFRQTNLISQPTLASILDLEKTAPTGRVTRNPPIGDGLPGTINSVAITFINISKAKTDGIDLALRYTRPTDLGRFGFQGVVTYTHSYDFNGVESVKANGFPMFRGNASAQWSRGFWSASVHGNYIDGYAELSSTIFGPGRAAAHRIGHHYTFNPQISYAGWFGAKVTLGANNVFDRDPPLALGKVELYDHLQVSGEGRFVFVRVSKDF
jgi:iron complex outermembrane recepter protein